MGEIICVQYTKKSLRGFENEEVAAAVLKFENGALGSVSVSDRQCHLGVGADL